MNKLYIYVCERCGEKLETEIPRGHHFKMNHYPKGSPEKLCIGHFVRSRTERKKKEN